MPETSTGPTRREQQPEKITISPDLHSLLREVSTTFNSLKDQAERALTVEGSASVYGDLLRERAQLIADLPERARVFAPQLDSSAASEVFYRLDGFAELAQRALREKTEFAMAVLLVPRGSTMNDPNLLEELLQSCAVRER